MRFRPANISLINRRHYLPRLLLTLSSKVEQQRQTHKSVPLDRVTPYQRPLSRVEMGYPAPIMASRGELPRYNLWL